MRIYLDMCCYNRPYDDQTQLKVAMETQSKLYIQMLIKEKKMELIASYQENAVGYVGGNRKKEIEVKATEIMKAGVKFKDACHVASAIYAECEYFISTDIRLLKYNTQEIKMVTPIEFITEMESDE